MKTRVSARDSKKKKKRLARFSKGREAAGKKGRGKRRGGKGLCLHMNWGKRGNDLHHEVCHSPRLAEVSVLGRSRDVLGQQTQGVFGDVQKMG